MTSPLGAWQRWARCYRDKNPPPMWDIEGDELRKTRRYCGGCPVQALCLLYGMGEDIGSGRESSGIVFGGTTRSDRIALKKGEAVTDLSHTGKIKRNLTWWRFKAELEERDLAQAG